MANSSTPPVPPRPSPQTTTTSQSVTGRRARGEKSRIVPGVIDNYLLLPTGAAPGRTSAARPMAPKKAPTNPVSLVQQFARDKAWKEAMVHTGREVLRHLEAHPEDLNLGCADLVTRLRGIAGIADEGIFTSLLAPRLSPHMPKIEERYGKLSEAEKDTLDLMLLTTSIFWAAHAGQSALPVVRGAFLVGGDTHDIFQKLVLRYFFVANDVEGFDQALGTEGLCNILAQAGNEISRNGPVYVRTSSHLKEPGFHSFQLGIDMYLPGIGGDAVPILPIEQGDGPQGFVPKTILFSPCQVGDERCSFFKFERYGTQKPKDIALHMAALFTHIWQKKADSGSRETKPLVSGTKTTLTYIRDKDEQGAVQPKRKTAVSFVTISLESANSKRPDAASGWTVGNAVKLSFENMTKAPVRGRHAMALEKGKRASILANLKNGAPAKDLTKNKLGPRWKVDFGAARVVISDPFILPNERIGAVAYMKERGKYVPRVFYRSLTDNMWRAAVAKEDGNITGKVPLDAINLPIEAQLTLEKLVHTRANDGSLGAPSEAQQRIFFELLPDEIDGEMEAGQLQCHGVTLADLHDDDLPDFDHVAFREEELHTRAKNFHNISAYVFPSKNNKYRYLFFNSEDHFWLGGVELVDGGGLTSFGTPRRPVLDAKRGMVNESMDELSNEFSRWWFDHPAKEPSPPHLR